MISMCAMLFKTDASDGFGKRGSNDEKIGELGNDVIVWDDLFNDFFFLCFVCNRTG